MKRNEKNKVVIAVGSNHEPETHIASARSVIEKAHPVSQWSVFEKTQAIGDHIKSPFLNGVVYVETDWDQEKLKTWLKEVENQEGRDRQQEALVTLDLDIIMWNGQVVDPDFFQKGFLKKMLRELQVRA